MAIVQISQIKHRRGTNENLPQLASAELGWSVDTQQLYIGNGTLEEGAPEVGNTEILTQNSPIPGLPATQSQTLSFGTTANVVSSAFTSANPGVTINYTILRGGNVRQGYLRIGQFLSNLAYDEEYTETADVGVTFVVIQIGSSYAQVSAITSNTGYNASINANLKFTSSTLTY
jgi:hypothetical protein